MHTISALSFEITECTVDLQKHGCTELPIQEIPTSPEKSPIISKTSSEDCFGAGDGDDEDEDEDDGDDEKCNK
jgi:hypothetical protein